MRVNDGWKHEMEPSTYVGVARGVRKEGISTKGKPVDDVKNAFHTACEQAGIGEFRFHDPTHIRFLAGNERLQSGCGLKTS